MPYTFYKGYLQKNYTPQKDDVVVRFLTKPAKNVPIEVLAQGIAAESSIGTWTKLTTLKESTKKKLGAKVFKIKKQKNNFYILEIAYPIDLFELGSMPQFYSSITGNIFGVDILQSLRVLDVSFPKKYLSKFKGPSLGIPGIRKITKTKRPLVGTIVKPKLGLTHKEHAKVAYESWLGGLDIVKDDENLTSMTFNNFYKRISLTLKMKEKAEKETGEKKLYVANTTAPLPELEKRIQFIKDLGGEVAMLDIFSIGASAVQYLRDKNFKLIFHGHRAGHAAFTRGVHGESFVFYSKIYRILGIDQLHTGAIIGKMVGDDREELMCVDALREKQLKDNGFRLNQDFGKIKPAMPILSGGLHPLHIPKLYKLVGKDAIFQFGGGVHGHPEGTFKGAMAVREVLEAVMEGKTIKELAKNHREIKKAVEKWGA